MDKSEDKVIISRSKLDELESELANFRSGVKYSELRRKLHNLEKEKESLTRNVFESMKAYNEKSKELSLLMKSVKAANENAIKIAEETAEDKRTINRLKSRVEELERSNENIIRWFAANRWKLWKRSPYNLK